MSQKQSFGSYHPPTYSSCNIILLNMKSHYRRLYTVKPAVDTSPPESYKLLSQKTNRSLSCLDLSLSNISTDHFVRGSEKMKNGVNLDSESRSRIKPIIKRHSGIISEINSNRHSRSKNKMQSSISGSRKASSSFLITSNPSKNFSLKDKVLFDSSKSGSDSSQDSAYNEGEVVSSERGSRSPTPDIVEKKLFRPSISPLNPSSHQRKVNNYVYLKFLTSITDEILKKGLVTNKALKQVFRHHFEANLHQLNQSQMQLELEALREKLGVPEDDDLDSSDFGLGSGTGQLNCQPLCEENCYSDKGHLAMTSKKSKSVCINGSATVRNALSPDMVEAFTALNDNKKLIDSIQASIKNTSINLQQVSEMSNHLSNHAEADYQSRSYLDSGRKSVGTIEHSEDMYSGNDFFGGVKCRQKFNIKDTTVRRIDKSYINDSKLNQTSRTSSVVETVLKESRPSTERCNLVSDAQFFSDEDSVLSGENSLRNIGKLDYKTTQSDVEADAASNCIIPTESNYNLETRTIDADSDSDLIEAAMDVTSKFQNERREHEHASINSNKKCSLDNNTDPKHIHSTVKDSKFEDPLPILLFKDENSSENSNLDILTNSCQAEADNMTNLVGKEAESFIRPSDSDSKTDIDEPLPEGH